MLTMIDTARWLIVDDNLFLLDKTYLDASFRSRRSPDKFQ